MAGHSKNHPPAASLVATGVQKLSPAALKACEDTVFHLLTCADTIHRGLPSCHAYFWTLFSGASQATTKFYAPLYLVSFLLSGRLSLQTLLKKILPAILRSSLAVSLHGSTFGYFSCFTTQLFGSQRPYVFIVSSIMCATLSILVERKQRRSELAVYVCNHAAECLFGMLQSRGIVRPIPYGAEILFALAYSLLVYFVHTKRESVPGSMTALFRLLLGDDSKRDRLDRVVDSLRSRWKSTGENRAQESVAGIIEGSVVDGLKGFLRAYGVGHLARAIMSFLPALFSALSKSPKNGSKLRTIAKLFGSTFMGRTTIEFALLLGVLSGSTKALLRIAQYVLVGTTGWKQALKHIGSGILAVLIARGLGLNSRKLLSHELMMYLLSKSAEAAYWAIGTEHLGLPYWKHGDSLLYVAACTLLFYSSVFEPWNLRMSYWAFLIRMSNGWFYDAVKGAACLRDVVGVPNNQPNYHERLVPLLTAAQRRRDLEIDFSHPSFSVPLFSTLFG